MFDLNRLPILWAIVAPIQIKVVHSSLLYQQATYQKYDRRGQESPSGYGPLDTKNALVPVLTHFWPFSISMQCNAYIPISKGYFTSKIMKIR